MENIKTVIFDLGRVLVSVDTSGEKFANLLLSAGITVEEAPKFWRLDEVRQHMTGEITSREFHKRATERFGLVIDYGEFAEGWCDLFRPVPAMKELFEEVSSRYAVGLLSDTDPLHWEKICGLFPWIAAIDSPTLSFEVGCLKPHPKMFEKAAANCGRPRGECLFIDDLIENVDGARCFGMPALQFSTPEKLRRDLAGLGIL